MQSDIQRTPRSDANTKKKRFGRRPLFRFWQVTHRWIALVTGVGLLLIVLTGAALLYKTPIQHLMDHRTYYPSNPSHQIVTADSALALVQKANPTVPISTSVHMPTGNWIAMNVDGDRVWAVDASTGKVLGEHHPREGFWALLDNVHECLLSCEGQPLYVAALDHPINWGVFGTELTWGGLILGCFGIVLFILVVGGLVLWWPGIRRISRGFNVRRGNRYKFNYDLHKVVGFAALPFLAMWAFTGANFELPFVTNLWYGVLPGKKVAEVEFASAKPPKGAQPITPAQAIAAVKRDHPGYPVVSMTMADPSDQTSTYSAYLAHGFDPWKDSDFPGDYLVNVDQFSGTTKVSFSDGDQYLSQRLQQQYLGTTHMGMLINGWWRTIWLLFGLTPLLLGITGTTTWWIRRKKSRAKKRRRRDRAAAGAAA